MKRDAWRRRAARYARKKPGNVKAVKRTLLIASATIDAWIGPFESFTIGDETIKNPQIRFADLWKDMTYGETGSRLQRQMGLRPMLLGADFLLTHRVLVAHSQRRIYFTTAGVPMFQSSRPLEPPKDPGHEVGTKPKTGEN